MELPADIELTPVERWTLSVARLANQSQVGKSLQSLFLRQISLRWVRLALSRRTLCEGIEDAARLAPEGGMLVVSNHRSFFDQYALLCSLLHRHAKWVQRMYFPVRSNFFYDHPAGLFINMVVAGGSMFPPVYREADRRALNDLALDQVTAVLQEKGTVVGMHPEGTRGKGPDPYQLLPAQPGVGKMALSAKPMVLPVFINGLGNDFLADLRRGFDRTSKRDAPVIAVFGKPVDYSALQQEKPRPTLYKRCADLFMNEIRKLSEVEKDLRQRCKTGEIDEDDPRWLING